MSYIQGAEIYNELCLTSGAHPVMGYVIASLGGDLRLLGIWAEASSISHMGGEEADLMGGMVRR